jgi:hypothetical protein
MANSQGSGRRRGRPPGSKSAWPWVRAANWALKHFADLDAKPPSPLAARLAVLGREAPDRLVLLVHALSGGKEAKQQGADNDDASPGEERPEAPDLRGPVGGPGWKLVTLRPGVMTWRHESDFPNDGS